MATEIKPAGWFNPWSEYHGYQQVAAQYEGKGDAVPLYSADAIADLVAENERLRAKLEAQKPTIYFHDTQRFIDEA